MGDGFQTLVVQDLDLDEAATAAKRIAAFLMEREIVLPEISREHALGGEGHAIGPRWMRAVKRGDWSSPEDFSPNGVAIDVGRALHGLGGSRLVCPACETEQPMTEAWPDAVAAYVDRGEMHLLLCASCRAARPLIDWRYDWPMAIGTLGVTFWNWWPLKKSFVEDIESLIEQPIVVVTGKL